MNKTKTLCSILRFSGGIGLRALLLRLIPRKALTILAYHRVTDEDVAKYPLDEGVISCCSAEFEREMEFIARHFSVISFRDLVDRPVGSFRNPLVITFDDGYRDNHDVVLPVLLKNGLKATFFVTAGFIESGEVPWWDEVAYCARHRRDLAAVACEAYLPSGDVEEKELVSDSNKLKATLLAVCKRVPDETRRQMLAELREKCGRIPEELARNLFMTWEHIRGLAVAGMEVGSHTMTHPVLSSIRNSDLMRWELEESKRIIEAQTAQDVEVLAYPVGGADAVSDAVVEAARDAGYRFACTYVNGLNDVNHLDPMRLLRLKTETGSDFSHFVAKILFPRLVRH